MPKYSRLTLLLQIPLLLCWGCGEPPATISNESVSDRKPESIAKPEHTSVEVEAKPTPSLPHTMRLRFGNQFGWITFEERTPGKVWAKYRLEPGRRDMVIAGKDGSVELPQDDLSLESYNYGTIKLTRDGIHLKGVITDEVDTDRCGEIELLFDNKLHRFTAKWRNQSNSSWFENIQGFKD